MKSETNPKPKFSTYFWVKSAKGSAGGRERSNCILLETVKLLLKDINCLFLTTVCWTCTSIHPTLQSTQSSTKDVEKPPINFHLLSRGTPFCKSKLPSLNIYLSFSLLTLNPEILDRSKIWFFILFLKKISPGRTTIWKKKNFKLK